MAEPITFLHLSDLHITPPGRLVHGIDPLPQVRRVLGRIRALDVEPAFVVVSGDLTDDGSAESYEVFREVLRQIGDGDTPVLLALGNHDDRATFRRVVLGQEDGEDEQPYCYGQTIDGLRVIVLDSVIPGATAGALGSAQLARRRHRRDRSHRRAPRVLAGRVVDGAHLRSARRRRRRPGLRSS